MLFSYFVTWGVAADFQIKKSVLFIIFILFPLAVGAQVFLVYSCMPIDEVFGQFYWPTLQIFYKKLEISTKDLYFILCLC